MKSLLLMLCLAVISVPGLAAPPGSPVQAPAVPRNMDAQERSLLLQADSLLARGQFDESARLLKPLQLPSVVDVYVDWTAVPSTDRPAYRQAVQQALDAWNQVLVGAARFQPVVQDGEADLLVLFEPDVAHRPAAPSERTAVTPAAIAGETTGQAPLYLPGGAILVGMDARLNLPAEPGIRENRRSGQIRVACHLPYTDRAASAAAVAHLVGKGLGVYLGLTPSQDPNGVMGPDTPGSTLAAAPTRQESDQVRQFQRVRQELLEDATRRIAVYIPDPVLAVEKTDMDIGDVWQGETAHFHFTLRNQGKAPLEIQAQPTCGCTLASADSLLAPGATGKIDADVRTDAFLGKIDKQIEVTTNDPVRPHLVLHLLANVLSVVQVLPTDRPMLSLLEDGPTVQEMEVVLHENTSAQLLQAVSTVPFITARFEPLPADKAGFRRYKLILTVRPEAPTGRTVCRVMLSTNSPRVPQTYITAVCEKGINAVPVSVFLGNITPATPLPVTQVVTLSRHKGTFHLRKIVSDDPSLEVQSETVQDGSQYRLKVTYRKGWSSGWVRRNITVETDDSHQPQITIPVVATVQAGGVRTP